MTIQELKIGILYWGKGGGGELLSRQINDACAIAGVESRFFLRKKNKSNKNISILNFPQWMIYRHNCLKEAKNNNVTNIIITMPSPWDIGLSRKFRKRGIKVTRIIHDATPHPGEIFPSKFWTRVLLYDADRIVTLSNFVKFKLGEIYNFPSENIVVGKLPFDGIVVNPNWTKKNQILLIGRAKKYKGIQLLLETWQDWMPQNIKLKIAGKGFKKSDLENVFVTEKWLDELEIKREIYESKVVVLPYLEASQSGIIPICLSLKVPVVITPVGGLHEQIEIGLSGLVCRELSVNALKLALTEAVLTEWNLPEVDYVKSKLDLLTLCIENM